MAKGEEKPLGLSLGPLLLPVVDVSAATFATESASICYFSFKDGEEKLTTATAALCAMLHQLLSDDSLTNNLARPAVANLWGLLVQCAERMDGPDVICALDALDECEAAVRNQLLYTLNAFYDDKSETSTTKNLKFLITSRPYNHIERSFRPFTAKAQYFRSHADERHEQISHDIDLVIDFSVREFAQHLGQTGCDEIATSLKEKGTKTYLWLGLTLSTIKDDPSLYSQLTDVSKSKREEITMALLKLILEATYPLTLDEPNIALRGQHRPHVRSGGSRSRRGPRALAKRF
ncbi:hypothetical protein PWT90_07489 [Aphanocladium album]|nr:hypothetical protein PWT90_07489 [Aphanocladium album]